MIQGDELIAVAWNSGRSEQQYNSQPESKMQ